MQKTHIPLTPEGYPFIGICAFVTVILALLASAEPAFFVIPTLLGLLMTAFCIYFFRDPVRVLPEEEGAIVCPADGVIIINEEMDDDRFLHDRVRKVSIFMNVFNVHVNRVPVTGIVHRVWHSPGRFYSADKAKAVLHNECCALIVHTLDQEQRYAMVQIAGLIARRIVCRAEDGDLVTAGERFGMIRFGSRVDLYLPLTAEIRVRVGEKVRAGETVLGILAGE
jgi:phosphatidylserine decarboxylase